MIIIHVQRKLKVILHMKCHYDITGALSVIPTHLQSKLLKDSKASLIKYISGLVAGKYS